MYTHPTLTIFGSYCIFFSRPGPRNFDRLHVYIEKIIDDKGSSRGAETYKATTLFYAPDIDLSFFFTPRSHVASRAL